MLIESICCGSTLPSAWLEATRGDTAATSAEGEDAGWLANVERDTNSGPIKTSSIQSNIPLTNHLERCITIPLTRLCETNIFLSFSIVRRLKSAEFYQL